MDDYHQTVLIENEDIDNLNNQIEDFDPNLVIDGGPTPYEQMEKKDSIKRLTLIINLLPSYQRKIILYKCGFKEDPLTFREIARKMNLKTKSVVRYYNLAISAFKTAWDDDTKIQQKKDTNKRRKE